MSKPLLFAEDVQFWYETLRVFGADEYGGSQFRTLDAAAVEDLRRSADRYVANWRRYTSGLRRIDHEAQSEAKVRG